MAIQNRTLGICVVAIKYSATCSDFFLNNEIADDVTKFLRLALLLCMLIALCPKYDREIKMLTKNVRRRSTELLPMEVKAAFEHHG